MVAENLPLDEEERLLARLVDEAALAIYGRTNERWFDKDGRPITVGEWYALSHEPEYVNVAYDVVNVVNTIATVWYGHEDKIFATEIPSGVFKGWTCNYKTLAEANEGHRRIIARVRYGLHPVDDLNL